MSKHAPDLLKPAFFADKVKLHKKSSSFSIRHGKTPHPLKVLHQKLVQYHGLSKSQLQTRHQLLDEIVRSANNYLRSKNPSRSRCEVTETVSVLAFQANRRLTVEQKRAKELEARINATPTRGVKVVGGYGANMRFERVAKGGGIAITGAQLVDYAERGVLGPVELTGNDINDFYALKKLLKTLTPEQLRLSGIRTLEYASDSQRREYAVAIDALWFTWDVGRGTVHTLDHLSGEVPGFAHYACDLNGDFFVRKVAEKEMGKFAHSSFLAGESALCAGTICIEDGRLIEVTNESGHYQPKAENLADACQAILDAGYIDLNDAYALLTDFESEWRPPARSGRYRVPIELFAENEGDPPPSHGDFEVTRLGDGRHQYVHWDAASARGCTQEAIQSRTETTHRNCLKSFDNCAGPQYLPHRGEGIYVCPFCANHAQNARVMRLESKRIQQITVLTRRKGASMAKAHKEMADYAEQLIVDLLWESGIDRGGPAKCALLTCGSLARGESVTYSDIDAVLVLENDQGGTHDFYQQVIMNMNNMLAQSGLGATGFRFCPGGLSPMDTINNDGLRGTPEHIFHLIDTFIAREGAEAGAHLQGALHTKLIFGDRNLATGYQGACAERLNASLVQKKANAIADIRRFAQKMRTGDWSIPTGNELFINIKDKLYRPVHMIVHELAQYHGVSATSSRDQIDGLLSKNKMSIQVATMLINLLEAAGRLRMQVQLEQGQEFELLKLRNTVGTDAAEDRNLVSTLAVANPTRIGAVTGSVDDLKALLGLAEAFVATKSRGKFKKRSSPFKTSSPASYRV